MVNFLTGILSVYNPNGFQIICGGYELSTGNWLECTLLNFEWEGQEVYLGKNIQFLGIFAIVFKFEILKIAAFCCYVSSAYPV